MKKLLAVVALVTLASVNLSCGLDDAYWCEGCGPWDDYGMAGGEGAYMSMGMDDSGSMGLVATTGTWETDPVKVAEKVVANHTASFTPTGCFTAVLDGAGTVDLKFNNCKGKHTIRTINGSAKIKFTAGENGPKFALTGELKINATAHKFNSTGVLKNDTGTIALTYGGSVKGEQNLEHVRVGMIEQKFEKATGCREINANWSATPVAASTHAWTTVVTGIQKCNDMCPTAGTVTRTEGVAGGKTTTVATLSFDGTDKAKWVVGSQTGYFFMECTPVTAVK